MKLNFSQIILCSVATLTICNLNSTVYAEDDILGNVSAEENSVNTKNIPAKLNTKDGSLTDYIQNNAENTDSNVNSDGEENKTWINSLVNTVAEKGAKAISGSDDDAARPRSNASVFDISGVMLRMNQNQVVEAMQKRGYQKTSEKFEIPNFIRWRYEEMCRNQGVVGYERIGNCVVQMSKKNNYQYVQQMIFQNFRTKESMTVFYTSNFTGNKVYRIIYHTEAANIKGSGAKANYLRNIKIYDFWKKINQKYGVPDNKEQVIWGLGDNKPYLQAATGKLALYDPMLLELDYTRMSREDQRFMNTDVYTF
jgi:hypothetical protein